VIGHAPDALSQFPPNTCLTEYDTPKLPAWHNQVDNNAGYTYPYTARLHEAAADHRENAAMDYHHFPTTTTNTTLVRY
jgi:hypothetical protein